MFSVGRYAIFHALLLLLIPFIKMVLADKNTGSLTLK